MIPNPDTAGKLTIGKVVLALMVQAYSYAVASKGCEIIVVGQLPLMELIRVSTCYNFLGINGIT